MVGSRVIRCKKMNDNNSEMKETSCCQADLSAPTGQRPQICRNRYTYAQLQAEDEKHPRSDHRRAQQPCAQTIGYRSSFILQR